MLEACLQQLKQAHLRLTKNRLMLLEILHAKKTPLSPGKIVLEFHRRGRQANKTTIYRELELFTRLALVRRVMMSDRKQYFELTEHGHHHHLICTQCEQVQDITLHDTPLIKLAEAIGKKRHFRITQHAFEFYGECATCLNT